MDAHVEAHTTPSAARAVSGPIVPIVSLYIAGGVLILLIVAIAGNWLWPLNFFHVAAGSLWTSIDLFMGFVIGPILARLAPDARMQLTQRLMPKMLVIMPTLVLITLTSGWQLARHLGNLTVPYPQHWWLTASFIIVGVMAIIAYGVLEPANIIVLLEIRKPQPNVLLIQKVMRRFIYTAGITGLMQLAMIIIMTRIATW